MTPANPLFLVMYISQWISMNGYIGHFSFSSSQKGKHGRYKTALIIHQFTFIWKTGNYKISIFYSNIFSTPSLCWSRLHHWITSDKMFSTISSVQLWSMSLKCIQKRNKETRINQWEAGKCTEMYWVHCHFKTVTISLGASWKGTKKSP